MKTITTLLFTIPVTIILLFLLCAFKLNKECIKENIDVNGVILISDTEIMKDNIFIDVEDKYLLISSFNIVFLSISILLIPYCMALGSPIKSNVFLARVIPV